jgi:hypothetical protein
MLSTILLEDTEIHVTFFKLILLINLKVFMVNVKFL